MVRQAQYRVAVDVGGTFIDFVRLDEGTGEIRVEKVPSLSDRLPAQFMKGLAGFEIPVAELRRIFHGMTVGINALVQERGAKVGLITTRGFRDVLQMGRGGRKPVYDFVHRQPPPIVERELRREVTERIAFTGEVLEPIDLEELDREITFLLSRGVEAIAITFLHAYAHPVHEIAARDRIAARCPGLPVTISHEITSEWREYERTSTTVLNAFIRPTVETYLDSLQEKLDGAGYECSLAIMQSSGGVADTRTAAAKPIRTLMSGPAGGVIGAKFLCDRLGYKNVICTDVGGTTYDVAIIEDGRILERSQTEVGGRPVLGALIDVASIGAGGGSIAWLDHRKALQVGPHSAGASPGPACFGAGGMDPTVTDAHVVMGWLDPKYFLGGRMNLEGRLARRAVEERIAQPLQLDLMTAAHGIVTIAATNMANAIRTKTVERGLDPREFVVLAYGGGGGLFACAVAEELEVPRVILPRDPAVFSAWGILTTDYTEDEVRTRVLPFDHRYVEEMLATLSELEAQVSGAIEGYGFAATGIERVRRLDLRFKNQEYTITVDLPSEWGDAATFLAGARKGFVEAHRRLYGHGDFEMEIELVSIRCRAIGRIRAPAINKAPPGAASAQRTRPVYFKEARGMVKTPVVRRDSLSAGQQVEGPVVVDEWSMTTLVPPGWRCACDDYGNLVLEPSSR